jgi:MHS family proline/betaine transporter-like MFS transporter
VAGALDDRRIARLRADARAGTLAHRGPLVQAVSRQRAALLRAFAISALGSITYYVGITYVPAFLTTTGAMGEADSLWLSTVAAVAVIVVTPVVGLLSDRYGRKPALVGAGAAQRALPVPLFTLLAGASPALRCSARSCWRWSRAGSARSARSPPASSSPRTAARAGSGSATRWRRRSSAG